MAFNQHCQDCLNSGYVCRLHTSASQLTLPGLPQSDKFDESMPGVEKSKSSWSGCECGSKMVGHKDYTQFHSFWCPVYRKD